MAEPPASDLPPALTGIEGAEPGESMFGSGPALWVNGKEVLHLDGPGRYDLRLTRTVIRELRAELNADDRVRLRRSSSSDWIDITCAGPADEALLVELTKRAVATHRPPPGTAGALPPTGADLARRRRFH